MTSGMMNIKDGMTYKHFVHAQACIFILHELDFAGSTNLPGHLPQIISCGTADP